MTNIGSCCSLLVKTLEFGMKMYIVYICEDAACHIISVGQSTNVAAVTS